MTLPKKPRSLQLRGSSPDKRQRITQIVRHNANGRSQERYSLLYTEFDKRFHCDVKRRMNNAKENKEIKKSMKQMEYICVVMEMTNELYDIACKVFENDVEELKKEWDSTIK